MAQITNPEDLMDEYTSGAGNEQDKPEEKEIFKKKLNTEFPLSGGETEEEWENATEGIEDDEEEDEEIDEEEDKQDTAEFKRRLDTEFPLSGGEAV